MDFLIMTRIWVGLEEILILRKWVRLRPVGPAGVNDHPVWKTRLPAQSLNRLLDQNGFLLELLPAHAVEGVLYG